MKVGHVMFLVGVVVWGFNSIWNFVWAVVNTFYGNPGMGAFNGFLSILFMGIAAVNLHAYLTPKTQSSPNLKPTSGD